MWPREKRFADLLIKQKRPYQYESKQFKLKNTTYQPDFYLPNEKLYIEVVGTKQAFHANKEKLAEFRLLYPKIKFIVVDLTNPQKIKFLDSNLFVTKGHFQGKCNPKNCLTCKLLRRSKREAKKVVVNEKSKQ